MGHSETLAGEGHSSIFGCKYQIMFSILPPSPAPAPSVAVYHAI